MNMGSIALRRNNTHVIWVLSVSGSCVWRCSRGTLATLHSWWKMTLQQTWKTVWVRGANRGLDVALYAFLLCPCLSLTHFSWPNDPYPPSGKAARGNMKSLLAVRSLVKSTPVNNLWLVRLIWETVYRGVQKSETTLKKTMLYLLNL